MQEVGEVFEFVPQCTNVVCYLLVFQASILIIVPEVFDQPIHVLSNIALRYCGTLRLHGPQT